MPRPVAEKPGPEKPGLTLEPRSFYILFAVSIVVAIGNTGLMAVLPAIARETRIADWMISAVFGLSALLWAIMSPIWARVSDRRGRKPLIMLGLAGFAVSMLLCACVVTVGLYHLIPPVAVFLLFLVCRALFGLIGSSSNPATQAYLAERTSRADRTQQMAALAGAFGLGTVVGPFLAPLLIVPFVTLAGPMFAFALLAAATLLMVRRYLPEEFTAPVAGRAYPKATGKPAWRRARGRSLLIWRFISGLFRLPLRPFLIYGFLVACCQTAQGYTLGFMIIDKLGVEPKAALGPTAVAMGAGALSGLLAQWGLIRVFHMGPRSLLRWGVGLAALGNVVTVFSPDYMTMVAGFAISSLGYGFARPGFTAGASLTVKMSEQARAAGAIAAVNGLNVILAPLFVALYGLLHEAPFALNALICSALLLYAFKNAILRDAGETPPDDEETAQALMGRRDEGGS
ncbi:MAG TPA: MFS transporter [Caulobacter sp.]|nr:MFS transporter [Caulobacter sp.]